MLSWQTHPAGTTFITIPYAFFAATEVVNQKIQKSKAKRAGGGGIGGISLPSTRAPGMETGLSPAALERVQSCA